MNKLTRNIVTTGLVIGCSVYRDGGGIQSLLGIALLGWLYYLSNTAPQAPK